jgi:hypothetical protein
MCRALMTLFVLDRDVRVAGIRSGLAHSSIHALESGTRTVANIVVHQPKFKGLRARLCQR